MTVSAARVPPGLTAGSGLKLLDDHTSTHRTPGSSRPNSRERIETCQLLISRLNPRRSSRPNSRERIETVSLWLHPSCVHRSSRPNSRERIETRPIARSCVGVKVPPGLTAGSGLKR